MIIMTMRKQLMVKYTTSGNAVMFILVIGLQMLMKPSNAGLVYNVVRFGAKPDGRTDSTQAFYKAWSAACYKSFRLVSTVYVPRGTYLLNPIEFNGPCRSKKILFRIDGMIVAPSDFWVLGKAERWILFHRVHRLTISGGTLDARGSTFWACRRNSKHCPAGARSLSLESCGKVVVKGLKSLNSQIKNISVFKSRNILLKNVKIISPTRSANTDGVHVQSSTGITITGATIRTGDDCISIGPSSKNIWIQGIACGPGHGISIGSLGEHVHEGGVQNVVVTGAVFTRTENGVRIKSWPRPSTGFVRGVTFRNIVMNNVYNPIIIDQHYCPDGHGCQYQQNSGVKISGVTYQNIKGTSASQGAIQLLCSGSNPCWGITLLNIKLFPASSVASRHTRAYCTNAHGYSRAVIPRRCF